jgi:thymidine phosphorylase
MLSGRGLGPTGGTLDKLESIPGFRTSLSIVELQQQVLSHGCVITGTTAELAPADRRLYALRDVTGTVPSIPLITGSIMSKKLSESPAALVLDVKFGSGAFMKTATEAAQLAESLVRTGTSMQVRTTALLTDMNQPLGAMCGNALEVQEAVQVMQGAGPADVRRLSVQLAAQVLVDSAACADAVAAAARCMTGFCEWSRRRAVTIDYRCSLLR